MTSAGSDQPRSHPVNRILILGGGSAGFLAAIALRTKLPQVPVTVLRSREIGIIGVGEGSTRAFTQFLHRYLKVPQDRFFAVAQPTWKLGLRFLWGPRPYFNYTFVNSQIMGQPPGLRKVKAYYCDEVMEYEDPVSALMTHDRVFERLPNGAPAMHETLAYHFENEKFVRFLEEYAATLGVAVVEETVVEVRQDEAGVRGLVTGSGQVLSADLYVDASGFGSVLLGRALGEPFVSYTASLFCDRAVVGGWDRTSPQDQVIKPYTTCQTMDAGWCWQIEHEHRINRGYVYSGAFVTDEQAEREFRAANPKVGTTRVVRFTSGRYERAWVKNVVAVGNASGFVEPLEATALGVIGLESFLLADALADAGGRYSASQVRLYNRHITRTWDHIRAFLAIHYKFNTRLNTPFWQHCREHTDLAGAQEIVDHYQQNGPSPLFGPTLIDSANPFGLAGYYALLVGQKVPYAHDPTMSNPSRAEWKNLRAAHRARALRGFTIVEALKEIRSGRAMLSNAPQAKVNPL